MDTPSQLFESLQTFADIQRLCDEQVPESVYLELKRKADHTKPELDRGDSAEFAKSLSGFANSDGGVLVWGVGTAKGADGDRADAPWPIRDFRSFLGRLKDSILNATVPVVDGVVVEGIPADDAQFGFVKCLIPRSERTPHRSSRDHEYYKRSTDDFRKLEHFDLEDMFGRRPAPHLEVALEILRAHAIPHEGDRFVRYNGDAVITITNAGRGSARSPNLGVALSAPYSLAMVGGVIRRPRDDRRFVYAPNGVVIHHGFSHDVPGIRVSVEVERGRTLHMPPELRIDYDLGSEDSRTISGQIVLSPRQIAEGVLPDGIGTFLLGG